MNESIKLGDGYWAFKENALLAYNDENNNFKPIDLNSTRASSATRVNKLGLIESVNTGVPRVDYLNNPKGSLLVEPQSTNLVTYSEDFSNVSWTKSSTTIVANNAISPSGTLTADLLYPTSSGNFRHIRQSSFNPWSGIATASIYVKAAGLTNISIYDYDLSGIGVNYNLATGVATDYGTNPFIDYSMTHVGDGWYRCTATALNGTFYWLVTNGGSSVSVTANGTDGVYIWGAQLEALPYATSYIPTVASTVTRVAETVSKTGISSLIGQTEGTVFIDTKYSSVPVTASGRWFNVFDTTNNISLALNGANFVRTIINGASDTITTSPKTNLGVKIAFAYNSLGVVLFINGVQYPLPNGGSQIITSLNSIVFDPLANPQLQTVDVNLLALWKERLSNETLTQLTTL